MTYDLSTLSNLQPYNETRFTPDDNEIFNSVMNSMRSVSRLEIGRYSEDRSYPTEYQLTRLKIILEKYGSSLKSLLIEGTDIKNLLELLAFTPNLDDLSIKSIRYPEKIGKIKFNTPELPHLKSLSYCYGSYKSDLDTYNFIEILPVNVLKKVELTIMAHELPAKFLRSQSTISELKIIHNRLFNMRQLKPLIHLEHLILLTHEYFPSNFSRIAYQHKLKTLEHILCARMTNSHLAIACTANQLTVLHVHLDKMTPGGLHVISRLENLNELKIICKLSENEYIIDEDINSDYYDKLTAIKNQNLKKLNLVAYDERFDSKSEQLPGIGEILEIIAFNNPNIELLQVIIEDLDLINQIVHNFRNLKAFFIRNGFHHKNARASRPFAVSDAYINITSLKIPLNGSATSTKNALTLVDQCTNLEHLILSTDHIKISFTFDNFQRILKRCPQLKSVQMKFGENYIVSADQLVAVINKFGHNLEYLEFQNISDDHEHLNSLTGNFSTINIDRHKRYKDDEDHPIYDPTLTRVIIKKRGFVPTASF